MKQQTWQMLAASAAFLWATQAALAESPDCDRTAVPEKIEGRVVKVEPEQGKVAVRADDGTLHEFQATRETLAEYKAGDSIKARLRSAPNCDRH